MKNHKEFLFGIVVGTIAAVVAAVMFSASKMDHRMQGGEAQ